MSKSSASTTGSTAASTLLSVLVLLSLAFSSFGSSSANVSQAQQQTLIPPPYESGFTYQDAKLLAVVNTAAYPTSGALGVYSAVGGSVGFLNAASVGKGTAAAGHTIHYTPDFTGVLRIRAAVIVYGTASARSEGILTIPGDDEGRTVLGLVNEWWLKNSIIRITDRILSSIDVFGHSYSAAAVFIRINGQEHVGKPFVELVATNLPGLLPTMEKSFSGDVFTYEYRIPVTQGQTVTIDAGLVARTGSGGFASALVDLMTPVGSQTSKLSSIELIIESATNPPPSPPALIRPSNDPGANPIIGTDFPQFVWTVPAGYITQYRIQINTDPQFPAGFGGLLTGYDDFSSFNWYTPYRALADGQWYVHVRAASGPVWSDWSPTYRFIVQTGQSYPPLPPSPSPPDNATFVSDVTLPDGSVVSPGQALVKTWRVRNSGTSTWDGYKLIFLQGDQMGGASPVNISTTSPNQEVNISVSLQAPTTPGDKVGYWQIVNRDGVYVPGGKLWVSVNVVSSTTSDHIAVFSADPPSPSSASTVRLYARVNWWPQFRAMRVKVDNQIIGETAAAEYTFNWDTSSASRGDHTLVLEIADQTDTSWSHPERRVLGYTLQGTPAPANHAPNRPSPSSPYDWYVYYSGNTAQLCAQANGDPDGDAITGYYFDIYGSAQLWNSGWVGSNCATTGALGPYNYQWRVKVRDSRGAESDWSDTWHFTLVNPNLSISELYFQPQDGNSEQVKIRACTTGQGGVGITMRVSVNDANDGSGNGTWHIIKELGVPCFNDVDAPVWNTLEYGDGPHRVRAEAHGASTGWNGAAVREETYTLPHRRPASPRLLAPIPPSGNIREAVYLNSRTVTFRWQPTIRANSYTLHIGTNPSPKDDSNPVFRQTFGSSVTEYTVNFSQDYPTLYWQVTASNDVGTNASGDQLFGIDRTVPSCAVQPLPAVTYESVFQVNWSGSDNLAGIRTFDVQYLDSGRDVWSDWFTGIPVAKTYDLFTGQPGHTYSFRCRATDNANNTGNYPANADTSTKIDPAARPPTPWWNSAYSGKRNLTILNNMPGTTLPIGYPVRLHFDGSTTPTAAEIYNASQSSTKCNDLRIVYNDATELDRVIQNCSSSAIDLWFRTQVSIPGGSSNNTAHQLYYGNPGAGTPPAEQRNVWYPPSDANAVGLWYFSEGSGATTADLSGYGNNGSIGSLSWTDGKFGKALYFPEATSGPPGVRVPGSASLDIPSFTYEAFVKAAAPTYGWMAAQGEADADRERWAIWAEGGGNVKVEIWGGAGQVQTGGGYLLSDGNWHHLAVTFNGGNRVRFYRDGQLYAEKTLSGSGMRRSGPANLYIGSGFGSNTQRFFGAVDQVRFSDVARDSFPHGAFALITSEPSTAAGATVAPPVTGSPDLAVLSLTAYPNPGGGILVQAVVKNQGNLSTQNGFYTDLYANHLPTGAGDYTGSIHFWVARPIEAGSTATLTTVITDLPAGASMSAQGISAASETTSTLYAQVDSTGAVSEPDKLNNISGGTEVCIASADSYESDDTATTARLINVGTTETHNFHAAGDQDWFKFEAWAGNSYTIEIANLGLNSDTYLYLYDTNGTTMLAANDDYGGTLASKIIWQAPANGTYYVMVKHWNPNVGGCGTGYELSVTLFGDLDRDCDVDVVDVQTVASRWRCKCGDACYNSRYDLDGDCDIDIVDVMKVAAQWGNTCASRTNTPTPTYTPTNTPTPTSAPTPTPTLPVYNVWTQCSQGMWGGAVRHLALSPGYATDRTLFTGTWYSGVFKSTDGGASWSAVNTGLTNLDVRTLALSPGYATDRTLFTGTWYSGVFKSTDGGASWSAVNTGLTNLYVFALALSPGYATDRTLFTGTLGGVFKSADGGASWSAVNTGLTNLDVRTLALSPGYASDRTIFAGTWDSGVFKSTDSGASWNAVNTGLTNLDVWSLSLSPGYATDRTIFAGTYGGLFKSTDGGVSWSAVNTGLTNLYVFALALSPGYATDRTIFAGTYGGGVFKSTDGGASWSAVNTGLNNLDVRTLALSPGYAADHTLFAGSYGGGVFKSTDGGASWSVTGLTNLGVLGLALSPGYATDRTIFAGTDGDGVFKSTDGGASWNAAGLNDQEVKTLALSPGYAADHTLFAGTYGGGVFKSTDGGASWSATGLTNLGVLDLALSPGYATDRTLFAGTYGGGVFKSTDGGASWSATGLTNLGVLDLALSPGYATDRTIFAGTDGDGVFKSTDGGASWNAAGLNDQEVKTLALSPGYASDHTLFAGTWGGGVFKSTDGGTSWNAVNTGLNNLYVMALALSPGYATDHTLFTGTYGGGVFKSTDGGASWSAMNLGLGNLDIRSLALTHTYPRTLFAGTWGSSVWQYILPP